jgi:hypothetical protein
MRLLNLLCSLSSGIMLEKDSVLPQFLYVKNGCLPSELQHRPLLYLAHLMLEYTVVHPGASYPDIENI